MRSIILLLLLLVPGCAATEAQLRDSVTADLDCSNDIQVKVISKHRRSVIACGRSATYTEVCRTEQAERHCSWKRDGVTSVTVEVPESFMAALTGSSSSETSSASEEADSSDSDDEE